MKNTTAPERTILEINTEITELKMKLSKLFLERRGRMQPQGQFGYCAVCGCNMVWAERGEDTCPDCLSEM